AHRPAAGGERQLPHPSSGVGRALADADLRRGKRGAVSLRGDRYQAADRAAHQEALCARRAGEIEAQLRARDLDAVVRCEEEGEPPLRLAFEGDATTETRACRAGAGDHAQALELLVELAGEDRRERLGERGP